MPCLFEIQTSVFRHFISSLFSFYLSVSDVQYFIRVFLPSDWAPIFHFNHPPARRSNRRNTVVSLRCFVEGAFVSLVRWGGGKARSCDFVRQLKSVLKLFLGQGCHGLVWRRTAALWRRGKKNKGEAAFAANCEYHVDRVLMIILLQCYYKGLFSRNWASP